MTDDLACDWCGMFDDHDEPADERVAGDGSVWRLCGECVESWDAEVRVRDRTRFKTAMDAKS